MKIPSSWKKVKFGDVIHKVNDKVPNRDEWTFERYIGKGHINSGEIRITKSSQIKGNEEVIGPSFHMRFKPGHVLYMTRGIELRKAGMVDFEGVCSQVCFVLQADKTQLLQSLLPFIMQTEDFASHVMNNMHGSVNTFLNWKDIAKYEFLLPPLEEQKKISEVLWGTEESIKSCDRLVNGETLFQKKVIKEIILEGTKRKGWKFVKLKNISSLMTNGFVGIATPFYTDEHKGVKYLQSNNVRRNTIDTRKIVYVTKEFSKKHSKSILEEGDMLTVQSGHSGEICIVPKEFAGSNCHALIITRFLKDKVNPYYVSHYLNSGYGILQLNSILVGSTIKHINVKDLKNFEIPLPSLEEQRKISETFYKLGSHLEDTKKSLLSLKFLRNKLSNELLKGELRLK